MNPRIVLLPLLVLVAACSGSAVVEPVAPPPVVEPVATGPAYVAVVESGNGVERFDLAWGSSDRLSDVAGSVVARFPDRKGGNVAVVTQTGDSLRLGIADAISGTFRPVHSVPAPAEFTAIWSPDGALVAVGHYRPITRDARPAMGEGDILEVDAATGTKRRIGCSASKAVLAWLENGTLLVRDSDNLYVVDRDDCGTRSTVDARRMHGLTASPDGGHIAYVHRELVYNRTRRAYEPDSTFMMAKPDGSEERMVVSFRYRPQRFAWSPDASELAYDVDDPDRPGRRLISMFDVASGTNAYLHAPTPSGPSEFDARWSPDGSRLLYSTSDGSGDPTLTVWTTGAPFPWSIPESQGAEALMWAGNDAVVLRDPDGAIRLVGEGMGVFEFPVGSEPLAVSPHPSN